MHDRCKNFVVGGVRRLSIYYHNCSCLHPFPGHVQQENNRESTLSVNSKLFKMVNGKCVDIEPNTLVVSFLEMSSMRSETRNKDCMS